MRETPRHEEELDQKPNPEAEADFGKKQEHWNKLKKYFESKGIEEGIIKTIVGLNALGFQTYMSCEGQNKNSTSNDVCVAPWVLIFPPEIPNSMSMTGSDLAKASSEREKKFMSDTKELLDKFYNKRKPTDVAKITLWQYTERAWDHAVGISNGSTTNPGNYINAEQLEMCQEEFDEFADFLEKKYYSKIKTGD